MSIWQEMPPPLIRQLLLKVLLQVILLPPLTFIQIIPRLPEPLSATINAHETYKSRVTDDTSKLVVNTDAAVEIPDVEKISAISVTPAAVTQDLLDGITDAFFLKCERFTLQTAIMYRQRMRSRKKIDELKKMLPTVIWIPNNWGNR